MERASVGSRPDLFADKSAPTTSTGDPDPVILILILILILRSCTPVGVDLSTKTDHQTPNESLKLHAVKHYSVDPRATH